MELATRPHGGLTVHYRKGTKADGSSDEQALAEVLKKRAYRRIRSGFDVLAGERWLDLGANIGAFALYCLSQRAEADCYEPDPECFAILSKNVEVNRAPGVVFNLHNSAVTAFDSKTVSFRTSDNPENRYRGTVMGGDVHVPDRYIECPPVKNTYIGKLAKLKYDGVKMDIEGSEGPIFDSGIFPQCEKLVLEYHTSRDSSVKHLKKRLAYLKKRFKVVKYPSAYDKAIESGATEYRPRFDLLIFCQGWKG